VELRKARSVLVPVKAPAIDDDASKRSAMPTDSFCSRMDYNVNSILQRPAEKPRSCESGIDLCNGLFTVFDITM
jgi:hypothetical protein